MKKPFPQIPSSPTPSEYLVVCKDKKCNKSKWTMYIKGYVYHCLCGSRQREATAKEYEIAKKDNR